MKRWSNAYIFGLVLMGPLAVLVVVGQRTDWGGESLYESIYVEDHPVLNVGTPETSVYTVPPPSLLEVRCTGPTLEIIYRQDVPWKSSPVHKDVYVVKNGEIVYSHRVEAIVTPQQTIPEKIEWPE